MKLNPLQFQAVLDYILADPVLGALDRHVSGNAFDIITPALNAPAAPDFIVWTDCSVQEIIENGFIWTAVDSLSVGKARIWEWMSASGKFIDGRKGNVRQGLKDAFGNGSPMHVQIMSHLKRKASRVEKLFTTGLGSDLNPGTAVVEGPLDTMDYFYGVGDLPGWWIHPEDQ